MCCCVLLEMTFRIAGLSISVFAGTAAAMVPEPQLQVAYSIEDSWRGRFGFQEAQESDLDAFSI